MAEIGSGMRKNIRLKSRGWEGSRRAIKITTDLLTPATPNGT